MLISPDDDAVFEIHVGDWFGSTHHDEAMPIGPEIAASKVPLVCVHGAEENDSFCMKPQPAHVRVVDAARRASLQRRLHGTRRVDREESPPRKEQRDFVYDGRVSRRGSDCAKRARSAAAEQEPAIPAGHQRRDVDQETWYP